MRYIIAGIIAGFVSLSIASILGLSLTMVAIVTAGLAAFVAGATGRKQEQPSEGPAGA